MLSDLTSFKLFIRVANTDQDDELAQFLLFADAAAKSWTKRTLETVVLSPEYPFKLGAPDLPLSQRPIRPVYATATLTAGSPIITGLTTTQVSNILVGSPVTLTGAAPAGALTPNCAIPAFTTILSKSGTTATMSANAVTGGSIPLIFGLAVFFSPLGRYGNSPYGFPASSQMFDGLNYSLVRDEPSTGGSKTGLLKWIGFGFAGSAFGWGGWGFDGGYGGKRGGLTANLPGIWPRYPGSVQVSYCPGYGVGGSPPGTGVLPANSTLPADLMYAVNAIAAWIRVTVPEGVPIDSTALGRDVIRQIESDAVGEPSIGSVRAILARYRSGAM